MSEPFIGEIQIFGFNFAPTGWAVCNGATMSIAQNNALFSLLGTTYGGDGLNTFMLPDLGGRATCHQGQGPGLTPRQIGSAFGADTATVRTDEMPAHSHALNLFVQDDESKHRSSPSPDDVLTRPTGTTVFASGDGATVLFAPGTIGPAGGDSRPHENRQPYLATNFCIALQGVFPPFN